MKFIEREVQYPRRKKLTKISEEADGSIIVDEERVEGKADEPGTPITVKNLNKGNWRDDDSVSFEKRKDNILPDAQENETQIVTLANGETWLIPPVTSTDSTPKEIGKDTGTKVKVNNIEQDEITFTSDPQGQLNELKNEAVAEAPKDGKQYARKDSSWSEVQAGGGGTWGSITGAISSQTDLQIALDSKVTTNTAQTITGAKTFTGAVVVPTPTVSGNPINLTYANNNFVTSSTTSGIINNTTLIKNSQGGFSGGGTSSATTGGAIGSNASATNGFSGGYNAKATADNAVQLGTGTNANFNTLQYRSFQLVDGSGNIPAARLYYALSLTKGMYAAVGSTIGLSSSWTLPLYTYGNYILFAATSSSYAAETITNVDSNFTGPTTIYLKNYYGETMATFTTTDTTYGFQQIYMNISHPGNELTTGGFVTAIRLTGIDGTTTLKNLNTRFTVASGGSILSATVYEITATWPASPAPGMNKSLALWRFNS